MMPLSLVISHSCFSPVCAEMKRWVPQATLHGWAVGLGHWGDLVNSYLGQRGAEVSQSPAVFSFLIVSPPSGALRLPAAASGSFPSHMGKPA